MKQVDREALERAMALARADPMTARQLDDKLKDESWREVAEFASYHMQIRTLHLKPWMDPPCCGNLHDDKHPAAVLKARLLAAGLSEFGPSPIEALERAERPKPAA